MGFLICGVPLKRFGSFIAVTDANHIIHFGNEDFSIAGLPSVQNPFHGIDHLMNRDTTDDYVHFHFW